MPMVETGTRWRRRAWIFALMSAVTGSMWSTPGFEEESSPGGGGPAGEELGVAGGDDAVDDELTSPAVVRMQAVLLPRI